MESSVSSFLEEKLLTPMDLVSPRAWHSSMALHTALMSMGKRSSFASGISYFPGLVLTGQCTR